MMKHLIYALLLGAVALGFTACGGDDETPVPNNTAQDEQSSQGGSNNQGNNGQDGNGQGNVTTPEIVVNVDENGNADGGHTFVKIDDANFYIDDVKYTVLNNDNLTASGLVQNSTRPEITIVSQLNYGGKQMKVTSIGYGAFNSCTSLTSITLPNSLNSIGENAFYGCSGLTSIFIPKNITSIGGSPFSHCSNLSSIIVEEGNTRYDSRDGCNAIIETQYNELHCGCKNTVIPNSVKRMAKRAFQGCTGLTSITIPESMKGISQGAFSDCTGLTSITFHNSFVGIGENAFSNCTSLKTINIPESVTIIERSAFFGCSSLTSITIPSGVTSLGSHTFWHCSSLTSIIIPEGIASIEAETFTGCSSLKSVTLPKTITSIGYAFGGCSSLKDFYCHASSIPETVSFAFKNSSISTATLHVPAESLDAYRNTAPWSGFGTKVAL